MVGIGRFIGHNLETNPVRAGNIDRHWVGRIEAMRFRLTIEWTSASIEFQLDCSTNALSRARGDSASIGEIQGVGVHVNGPLSVESDGTSAAGHFRSPSQWSAEESGAPRQKLRAGLRVCKNSPVQLDRERSFE